MRPLAERLDIPILDQHAWLQERSIDPMSVHWRHDGHWNERGHEVAAEMIVDYLRTHPQICARRTGS